jgi:hypothetical protein
MDTLILFHVIKIKETIKETKSYIDPWEYRIKLADLSLELDGEDKKSSIKDRRGRSK